MRLIDADALIKKAYSEIEGMDKPYKDFGTILEWLVDKMPTIEPKRKKAKWINPSQDPEIMNKELFSDCSLCGFVSMNEYKYCPNCGSRMED